MQIEAYKNCCNIATIGVQVRLLVITKSLSSALLQQSSHKRNKSRISVFKKSIQSCIAVPSRAAGCRQFVNNYLKLIIICRSTRLFNTTRECLPYDLYGLNIASPLIESIIHSMRKEVIKVK